MVAIKMDLFLFSSKRESSYKIRFTFVENTINNSPKDLRAKFLGSVILFCFISMCKFDSLKNPFAASTSLPKLSFRFRRFILLVQMGKVISTNYGSSTSSWKPWRWVRLDLIQWGIYTSIPTWTKFTSSSRSARHKDIFPWNISQMITKVVPINRRIVISYMMKQGILFWIWQKVNWNRDNNMIRISQLRESYGRTNASIRK